MILYLLISYPLPIPMSGNPFEADDNEADEDSTSESTSSSKKIKTSLSAPALPDIDLVVGSGSNASESMEKKKISKFTNIFRTSKKKKDKTKDKDKELPRFTMSEGASEVRQASKEPPSTPHTTTNPLPLSRPTRAISEASTLTMTNPSSPRKVSSPRLGKIEDIAMTSSPGWKSPKIQSPRIEGHTRSRSESMSAHRGTPPLFPDLGSPPRVDKEIALNAMVSAHDPPAPHILLEKGDGHDPFKSSVKETNPIKILENTELRERVHQAVSSTRESHGGGTSSPRTTIILDPLTPMQIEANGHQIHVTQQPFAPVLPFNTHSYSTVKASDTSKTQQAIAMASTMVELLSNEGHGLPPQQTGQTSLQKKLEQEESSASSLTLDLLAKAQSSIGTSYFDQIEAIHNAHPAPTTEEDDEFEREVNDVIAKMTSDLPDDEPESYAPTSSPPPQTFQSQPNTDFEILKVLLEAQTSRILSVMATERKRNQQTSLALLKLVQRDTQRLAKIEESQRLGHSLLKTQHQWELQLLESMKRLVQRPVQAEAQPPTALAPVHHKTTEVLKAVLVALQSMNETVSKYQMELEVVQRIANQQQVDHTRIMNLFETKFKTVTSAFETNKKLLKSKVTSLKAEVKTAKNELQATLVELSNQKQLNSAIIQSIEQKGRKVTIQYLDDASFIKSRKASTTTTLPLNLPKK